MWSSSPCSPTWAGARSRLATLCTTARAMYCARRRTGWQRASRANTPTGWRTNSAATWPVARTGRAALAALPEVIGNFLPTGLDFARADLDAARIANEVVKAASVDEQFRAGTFGGRVLHALVAGAFTAALRDEASVRDMRLAIDQVLLERSSAAAASDARQEAALQRIEATLEAGAARLHLVPRHRFKAPPRDLRELLMTELRATDLVGRAEELAPLKLWLGLRRERRDIAVHCLTGQAGAGKTRLAIELCEWAEQQGWSAGFVRQEELERFHQSHHPSEWRWQRPTSGGDGLCRRLGAGAAKLAGGAGARRRRGGGKTAARAAAGTPRRARRRLVGGAAPAGRHLRLRTGCTDRRRCAAGAGSPARRRAPPRPARPGDAARRTAARQDAGAAAATGAPTRGSTAASPATRSKPSRYSCSWPASSPPKPTPPPPWQWAGSTSPSGLPGRSAAGCNAARTPSGPTHALVTHLAACITLQAGCDRRFRDGAGG